MRFLALYDLFSVVNPFSAHNFKIVNCILFLLTLQYLYLFVFLPIVSGVHNDAMTQIVRPSECVWVCFESLKFNSKKWIQGMIKIK